MKLISRNTDYAVRAVCYIAGQKNRLVTAEELVKHLNIPKPFLRKILQTLNKKNVLKSHRGIGGGFELARKPGSIYLLELIDVFQGPFKLNECFFKRQVCPNRKSCFLKKKIGSIEDIVHAELNNITIESIMKH